MRSKLAETQDFIELYSYHVGVSEVPKVYHRWCAFSLLAAAVSDRIWMEKFSGEPLYPNLYTILAGPSAIGKDSAINKAVKYAHEFHDRIGVYKGGGTAPYFQKLLSGQDRNWDGPLGRLYLVTPETAQSVGDGALAAELVKLLTALYSTNGVPDRKGTVSSVCATIDRVCINWLAGTTPEWLIECIPKWAVEGGFMGRCIIVYADYDLAVRHWRPQVPPDKDLITDYLRARLDELTQTGGCFHSTPEADAIEQQWYEQRPEPADPSLIATWKREHDLLLKLCMIHSLARSTSLVYDHLDMIAAQRDAAMALSHVPDILDLAASMHSADASGFRVVRAYIKRVGRMPRHLLVQRVSNRGINASMLDQHLRTLVERREVRPVPGTNVTGRQGLWYEWVGAVIEEEP